MKIAFYNFRKLGILFLLILLTSAISAQNINVEGVIEDENDGSTMVGVSILIKGTQKGTVSDINGKYKIDAPSGSTLVFSFVGYKTVETIVNKSIINVKLSPSVKMVDGRNRSTLFINQDNKALKHAFTRENPNGLPPMEQVTVKGVLTWDDTARLIFLQNMVNTVIMPKLADSKVMSFLAQLPPVEEPADEIVVDEMPF